jgi:hypothetical protein
MVTGESHSTPVRLSPGGSDEDVTGRWTITLEGLLGSSLKISDGTIAQELFPPEGRVWGDAMLDTTGTAIYLIESRRLSSNGYDPESVIRIPLPQHGLEDQTLKTEVVLDEAQIRDLSGISTASISKLFSISQAGDRMLLELGYEDSTRSTGNATYLDTGVFRLTFSPKSLTRATP